MHAVLIPEPNATHNPSGRTPWTFQHNGRWLPILDESGNPVPYPIEVARVGERYFTARDEAGAVRTLVRLEIREGDLQMGLPSSHTLVSCTECGESVPIGGIAEHLRAHFSETHQAKSQGRR